MKLIERLGLAALHKFDPETSHGLSIAALKSGLAPLSGQVTSSRLATTIAGLDLPNPIGLAAGYDKNAEVIAPLTRRVLDLSKWVLPHRARNLETQSRGCFD